MRECESESICRLTKTVNLAKPYRFQALRLADHSPQRNPLEGSNFARNSSGARPSIRIVHKSSSSSHSLAESFRDYDHHHHHHHNDNQRQHSRAHYQRKEAELNCDAQVKRQTRVVIEVSENRMPRQFRFQWAISIPVASSCVRSPVSLALALGFSFRLAACLSSSQQVGESGLV